ncbi:hypothetical protein ACIA5D_17810 [Actinoplanes sp. NPDC051513]|uniref:hypothetical protein n=1 Tax=Actinoplanes sp. NPDC051513 TaxID=3363908 RepID=UPI0037A92C6B
MNTSNTFEAIADSLVAFDDNRSKTKRAVLAAWMDHEGVPMMSAERYRHDPVIRALFAERGVTLLDPEDGGTAEVTR